MALEFEYKNSKLRVMGSISAGYWIEITPKEGGDARKTLIYRELSNAIDEAKSIVDAQIN